MPNRKWFDFVNPLEVFAGSCTFDELKSLTDFMASLTKDDVLDFYEAALELAIAEIKENGFNLYETFSEFLNEDDLREAMHELFEKVRQRITYEMIIQRFHELN